MTTGREPFVSSESRIKGTLCYFPFMGWIISGFLVLTEQKEKYVRFHALQSILFLVVFSGLYLILVLISNVLMEIDILGILANIIKNLLTPIYLLISLFLIYQTYRGHRFQLPGIGKVAVKHQ